MRKVWILSLLTVTAPPVCGQSSGSPAGVNFHGSLRSRAELWNWFDGAANSDYQFLGSIFRFGLSHQQQRFDWQLEFAAPVMLGLPADAAAAPPQGQLGLGATYFAANKRSQNSAMIFPKQAYLRFHHLGHGEDHSLRLGRFEFVDGGEVTPKNGTLAAVKNTRIRERLIGPFGFSHVARSFDGFHYSYAPEGMNLTVLGAFPSRGVFQTDGWGFLKAGLTYASLTKPVGGADNAGELRLFGIYYHDWRRIAKNDNRPAALRSADLGNVRIGTFGAHYIHAAKTSAGTVDLLLWGVLQTGRWSALHHRAGAVALEGGFQPGGLPALRPWLRGGYFRSSGDDDPRDGEHKTFFQILPTPRVYARFPFFNLMNLEDTFAELVLRPHPAVTIRSDAHALRLTQPNDLWYAGGGAFNPWLFGYPGRPSLGGRGLATLYDISVDLRATSSLTVGAYYGYANGKSVMANIYPAGKNAHYGYLEMLYRF